MINNDFDDFSIVLEGYYLNLNLISMSIPFYTLRVDTSNPILIHGAHRPSMETERLSLSQSANCFDRKEDVETEAVFEPENI